MFFVRSYGVAGALLLSTAVVLAADDETGDVDADITAAARQVAKDARREEYRKVVVVVRGGSGSQSDPDLATTLAVVRRQLLTALRAESLDADVSKEIDAVVAKRRRSTRLGPEEVSKFRKAENFDVLLSVEYRMRGRQRALRLDLIDHQESLWGDTLRLPNFGHETRKAADESQPGSAAPAVASPGSTATLAGPATTQSGESGNGGTSGKLPTLEEIQKANQELAALNLRVLRFAILQIGKQVGNGQCSELVEQALRAAGAKIEGNTFGTPIPLKALQPGDILQFTTVRIETGNAVYLMGTPNHFGIVYAVQGTKILMLHQNFGKTIVTPLEFDLRDVKQGSVTAYRGIVP